MESTLNSKEGEEKKLNNRMSSPRKSSVEETTEVKPLTKRKKKVKREIEPENNTLNGTLNGSITAPWSGRLEPLEYPEPFPGPYKTSLFWVRRGRSLDPVIGTGAEHISGYRMENEYESMVRSRSETLPGYLNLGTQTMVPGGSQMMQPGGSQMMWPGGSKMMRPGGSVEKTNVDNFKALNSSHTTAPWKKNKTATEVFLRVTFRKVGQIDTVSETFNADVIIQARWRFNGDPEQVDDQSEWGPMLYIENTDNEVIKVLHRELWVDPNGEGFIIQRMTARGVFTETMELDHFPFDCQKLTITIASGRHSGEITLRPDIMDPSFLYQGNFVDKQEWHLYEHVEAHKPESDECETRSNLPIRPALSFTCQAARRMGFFTWNVFLILVVIFLMHMCSFSVVRADYNPRLSISFIMFLTAIAFKLAISKYLPRISYLTYMDSYLLLQLVLMAFVCGWHATLTHLPTVEDVANRTDRIMMIIVFVLYLLFQIIYMAIVYFIPGKRRRELHRKQMSHSPGLKPPMSSYA